MAQGDLFKRLPLPTRLMAHATFALGGAMFVFIALYDGRVPVRHSTVWHRYRGHEVEFVAKTVLFAAGTVLFIFIGLLEADKWAAGRRDPPIRLAWLINLGAAVLFVILCAAMVSVCRTVGRLPS